jgi:nucleoside 2-deoxyribosyltransferase
MKPTVYLAGPIADTRAGQAFAWREYAAAALAERGVEARSPMRAKGAMAGRDIGGNYRVYEYNGWAYTPAAILARDYNDCVTANGVLMNLLGAVDKSFGTGMELAWAYDRHIPTVVVVEPTGNPHDGHPMFIAAVKFRVADLDDAIDAIAIILNR